MGRIGLSYETFKVALDEMTSHGSAITYMSLRERLGGGNNNTIGRYLDRWRNEKIIRSNKLQSELPSEIQSALINWHTKEVENIRLEFEKTINQQLELRDSLEKSVDDLEEILQSEKTLNLNLSIEKNKLEGRIEQILVDLKIANDTNHLNHENKSSAELDQKIIEIKFNLLQSEIIKAEDVRAKLSDELELTKAIEKSATDAATKAEAQLGETKIRLVSWESRTNELNERIRKYEEKISYLEDLLNTSKGRVIEYEHALEEKTTYIDSLGNSNEVGGSKSFLPRIKIKKLRKNNKRDLAF